MSSKNIEKRKEANEKFHSLNPNYKKEYAKKYYALNKSKMLFARKQWVKENRDRVNSINLKYAVKNRQKLNLIAKNYRKENKAKINKWSKQYLAIKRNTLEGKLNSRIQSRMRDILKFKKNSITWKSIVGYSDKDLIRKLFGNPINEELKQKYLSGELQIDHIVPLSWFKFKSISDSTVKKAWGLENLQLISKKVNLGKRDRYIGNLFVGLNIVGRSGF